MTNTTTIVHNIVPEKASLDYSRFDSNHLDSEEEYPIPITTITVED
jgi:hypothetical protein